MAKFGFQGTVAEFINSCDSNRIAEVIRDEIRPSMLSDSSEFRSWRDGLQKLANSLRINSRNNPEISELGVICELSVARSRADVVLTGRNESGLAVALIIELKQWSVDGIALGESTNTLFAHVGGGAHRESPHPLLQAQSYLDAIRQIIPQSDLDMEAIAFLPNMNENNIIIALPSAQVGENMFLKRNIDEFGNFLIQKFSQGDSDSRVSQLILENNFPVPSIVYEEEENEYGHTVNEEDMPLEIEQFCHFAGFTGSKNEFIELCDRNLIADEIAANMDFKYSENNSEFRSWREGLCRISHILREIDADLGVSCEFAVHTGRMDVLLTGRNSKDDPAVMVVEIKQWSDDGIGEVIDSVNLYAQTGYGGMRETKHPLWQAERYLDSLIYYLSYFEDNPVDATAVAFLPNLFSDTIFQTLIPDSSEEDYYSTNVFCANFEDFRNFLRTHFESGDDELRVMNGIADSRRGATGHLLLDINEILSNPRSIRPNETQQNAIDSIASAGERNEGVRKVIIIQGNPGTGKTIVGIRSLLQMVELGTEPIFISANTAAAQVLGNRISGREHKVLKGMIKTLGQASGLIKNSGMEYDVLILDEAQSIVPNSPYPPKPCTIEELIGASRTTVFLLDERQMTAHDAYGSRDRIFEAARVLEAEITEFDLTQQFRCGNNSNHLQFIGSLLYGDDEPESYDYDFRVFDRAREMHECIRDFDDDDGCEAGLVASYCWTFVSRNNPKEIDISLDDGDFTIRWNLPQGGRLRWMGSNDRIDRVGYPPEIQGQELTHAGVILGPDLFVNDKKELDINPWMHETKESNCIPGKKRLESKILEFESLPIEDQNELMELMKSRIRNQYWVLLSRGSGGCFVYSEDAEVRKYFRDALARFS